MGLYSQERNFSVIRLIELSWGSSTDSPETHSPAAGTLGALLRSGTHSLCHSHQPSAPEQETSSPEDYYWLSETHQEFRAVTPIVHLPDGSSPLPRVLSLCVLLSVLYFQNSTVFKPSLLHKESPPPPRGWRILSYQYHNAKKRHSQTRIHSS